MNQYLSNNFNRLHIENNTPLTVSAVIRNSRRYLEYKKRLRMRISIAIIASLIITICSIVFLNNIIVNAQMEEVSDPYVKGYTYITINPDDTLWSIASDYADDHYSSVFEYIREVKNLNGLTSDKIHSGSKLIIPVYVSDNK